MSEFYGYTACVAPSVTTNTSTSVGSGSFVANGNLTNLGGSGCNQTDHGFYVGTSTNYSSNTKHSLGARTTTGTFAKTITGLSSSSTYRVFAYSTNAVGETVGGMVTTTTALPGISEYILQETGLHNLLSIMKYGCGGTTAGPWIFQVMESVLLHMVMVVHVHTCGRWCITSFWIWNYNWKDQDANIA